MKRMITGLSALAIVAATAVPALAQDATPVQQWGELDMLERLVQDTLMEYNVEADVTELSLAQIAQIRDVANSAEPGATQQRKIEAIIEE